MNKLFAYLKLKLTAIVAWAAFLALAVGLAFTIGTTNSPKNYFAVREENVGESITAVFKVDNQSSAKKLKEIWIHVGAVEQKAASSANVSVKYGSSETYFGNSLTGKVIYNAGYDQSNLFNWQKVISGININTATYAYLEFTFKGDFIVNEIVFLDESGAPLQVSQVRQNGDTIEEDVLSAFLDEQHTFTKSTSYKNTLTQRESYIMSQICNLNGARLGVVDGHANALGVQIMGLGVAIFGANTFGLRIMPYLFTLLTIAALYFIGKKLFTNKLLAVLLPVFFTLSGVALTVGRFASVVPIFTFFALLSLYFMYLFFTSGATKRKFNLSFKYILLSGVFYTLAVAVHTFAIFTLLALAVMFIGGLSRQSRAFNTAAAKTVGDNAKATQLLSSLKYRSKSCLLLVFAAFVILPILFITIVYIPMYKGLGQHYGVKNFFSLISTDIFNVFKFKYITALQSQNTSSVFAWFVNARAAMLYSDGGHLAVSFSYVLAALSIFSFLGAGLFMLIITFSKQVLENEYNAYLATVKPYLFLLSSILAFTLPMLFIKNLDNVMFYPIVVFLCAMPLFELDRKSIVHPNKAYIIAKRKIATTNFYAYLFTALLLLNFLLLLPTMFAFTASASFLSAFKFLIALKPNALIN